MTAFDDARATWELLSEPERRALAVLGCWDGNVTTPGMLGRELRVTWQQAARTAQQLKKFGLVTVKSLPKQTSYGISGQGRACLKAGEGEPPEGCYQCGEAAAATCAACDRPLCEEHARTTSVPGDAFCHPRAPGDSRCPA